MTAAQGTAFIALAKGVGQNVYYPKENGRDV